MGTLFKTSFRQRERDLFEEFRERESARVKTYTFIRIKRERIREKFWADRAASSQSRTSFWSDKRLDSTRANLSLFIPRDHREEERSSGRSEERHFPRAPLRVIKISS